MMLMKSGTDEVDERSCRRCCCRVVQMTLRKGAV